MKKVLDVLLVLAFVFFSSINVCALPPKTVSEVSPRILRKEFLKDTSDWIEINTKKKADGGLCSLILRAEVINGSSHSTKTEEEVTTELKDWFSNSLDKASPLKSSAIEVRINKEIKFWKDQGAQNFLSKPSKSWDGSESENVVFLLSCQEVAKYVNAFGKGKTLGAWSAISDKENCWCLRNKAPEKLQTWNVDAEGRIRCDVPAGNARPAMWVDSKIFVKRIVSDQKFLERSKSQDEDSNWLEIASYTDEKENKDYSLIIRQNPIEISEFGAKNNDVLPYASSLARLKVNTWFKSIDDSKKIKNFAVPNASCADSSACAKPRLEDDISEPVTTNTTEEKFDLAFLLSYLESKLYLKGFNPSKDMALSPLGYASNLNFMALEMQYDMWLRTPKFYLGKDGSLGTCQDKESKKAIYPALWVDSKIFD